MATVSKTAHPSRIRLPRLGSMPAYVAPPTPVHPPLLDRLVVGKNHLRFLAFNKVVINTFECDGIEFVDSYISEGGVVFTEIPGTNTEHTMQVRSTSGVVYLLHKKAFGFRNPARMNNNHPAGGGYLIMSEDGQSS